MQVHCESCPAKYAIPDDKVRGRKVRIKCKHCGSPIVVDGTVLGASTRPAAASKPAPAPAAKTSAPKAAQPSPAATARADAKPQPAPKPAPLPAAVAPAAERAAAPVAAAAPRLQLDVPKAEPKVAAPRVARDDAGRPSASAWREPAALAPPARENATAGWREPARAAQVPRSVKRTMLGIPAPVMEPAKLPPEPEPEPEPEPAPEPQPPARPATTERGSARSVKRTMLGIPAPVMEPAKLPPEPEPQARGVAELESDEERGAEWTVAITDDQHEEMTTAEVIQAYADGRIDDDTFIWAEGMDDWKNPFDVPLIAAGLETRGFGPGMGPSANDEATVIAPAPSEQTSRERLPSGVWREPGSWRGPAADADEESDVSFDDVTVSMDSGKAAELLREAGVSDTERPAMGLADAEHDDVTLAVDSRPFLAESAPLSDMVDEVRRAHPGFDDVDDERTMAMERPPGSEPRPTGARNEDSVLFSLDALADSVGERPRPNKSELSTDDFLLAPAPAAPPPPGVAPPAPAPVAPAIVPGPEAAPAIPPPSHAGPPSATFQASHGLSSVAPAKRSSRAWLWLLLLLLLAAGAAAAAYWFREPRAVFDALGLP